MCVCLWLEEEYFAGDEKLSELVSVREENTLKEDEDFFER